MLGKPLTEAKQQTCYNEILKVNTGSKKKKKIESNTSATHFLLILFSVTVPTSTSTSIAWARSSLPLLGITHSDASPVQFLNQNTKFRHRSRKNIQVRLDGFPFEANLPIHGWYSWAGTFFTVVIHKSKSFWSSCFSVDYNSCCI